MTRKLVTIILCVLSIPLFLGACSRIDLPWFKPYQPNIQQGNLLSEHMLSELKIGMSKEQVVRTLGHPVLSNVLDQNHWVYAYTFQRKGRDITKKHLDLYFQNDRLVRTAGNYTPL